MSNVMQLTPFYAVVYLVVSPIIGRVDYDHFGIVQFLNLLYHLSGFVAGIISIIVVCINLRVLYWIWKDRT